MLTILATAGAVIMSCFVKAPLLRAGSYIVLLSCILYLFQVIGREDISWLRGLIKKKGSQK
jgi:hypothetical protein